MSPESLHSLLTLAFGFAMAGLFASCYQLVTERPASFQMLTTAARAEIVLGVFFILVTAPFIIMRNTIRGVEIENRNFAFAMLATIIAGIWSLMSGALVVKAIETIGLFAA